jgi:hypothetical protein
MSKSLFEDELVTSMETQLRKQSAAEKPAALARAAECLHAALEIFEEHGMTARADQVLKLLQKLAQTNEARDVQQMPSINKLMEAGLTQRDMMESAKGNPIALAKINLILRNMGLADHMISKYIGVANVMSEETAEHILKSNTLPAKIEWESQKSEPEEKPGEFLEFKSLAQKKRSDLKDRHTSGLTSEKMLKNLIDHGHPMNLANDCAVELPPPVSKGKLKDSDVEPEFMELFQSPSFDMDASDDELFGIEIKEDSLEVSENDLPMGEMHDFEDERD